MESVEARPVVAEAAPFHPRWWFWVAVAVITVAFVGPAYGPGLWQAAWEPYNAAWWQAGYEAGLQAGQAATGAKGMASWLVEGAGDATYNGTYTESGTYNGKSAYTNGSRWLWWDSAIVAWFLSSAKGTWDAYGTYAGGDDLPANPWDNFDGGTAPAPTVAGAGNSVSPSASPSTSPSASVSPSATASRSPSVSPSASPSASPSPPDAVPIYAGRVYDANGNGVEGVDIVATCPGEADVQTATVAGGGYSLINLTGDPAGKVWTISVSKSGWVFCPGPAYPYTAVASQEVTVYNYGALAPNFRASATVTGRVTKDGAPLAGVRLCLDAQVLPLRQWFADTDVAGEFVLQYTPDSGPLPMGLYLLTPAKSGYSFVPASRIVGFNDIAPTGQDFVAVTATHYTLSGRITRNGVGLAGVTVNGGAAGSAVTDGTGAFTLGGLADGTAYTVTPVSATYAFSPASRSGTVAGADVEDLDFIAVALGSISGQVLHANGMPLAGVTLTVGAASAVTGATGLYTIAGLPPGPLIVTPAKTGYTFSPATRSVQVAGAVTGVDFFGYVAPTTYAVSGTVLDGSANPVPGVLISAGAYSTYTAADGTWSLDVPNGTRTFTPSLPGWTFDPAYSTQTVNGAAISGVDFTGTAPAGVYSISGHVALGAGDLEGVTFLVAGFTFTTDAAGNYTITNLAPRTYTLEPVLAGYVFAPETLDVTIVAADVTGQDFVATAAGDTTDPVVVILTPVEDAELTGETEITWAATDDVGVVECRVLVDGNTQETLDPGLAYAYTWDPSGWSNGEHTIRVEADDAAGNTGYDEVTITVNRSLAAGTGYLFTVALPTLADNPDQWRLSAQVQAALGIFVPGPLTLPADPAERYNVQVGLAPADTDLSFPAVAWPSFHTITPERSFAWPADCASSFILGLRAQPQVVWSYWEDADYTSVSRIIPLPSGDLALLASPAALLKLTVSAASPALSVWESILTPPEPGGGDVISFTALWRETVAGSTVAVTPTITDGCYFDGKVLLAAGSYLVAKDIDTDDLSLCLSLPGVEIDAVAAGTSVAFVATWDGVTASLYSFTWASTRKLCDLASRAACLTALGNTVLVGDQDGQVRFWSGTALTTLYDTAQTTVNRLVWDGEVTWALTGAAGSLYRSSPSWQLDNSFALTQLYGAAAYGDDLYLGGNGGALWRLSAGAWASWTTLTGVTAIHDLYATDDALYVAASHSSGARLYRLEIAEPGGFTCGVEPPDLALPVLRYA